MKEILKFMAIMAIVFITKSANSKEIKLSRNNCIELTQKQSEGIGFVFKDDMLNFYALIGKKTYCIYNLPAKGKFETFISFVKKTKNKYYEDYYPAYVLNSDNKILFSSKKDSHENMQLLPILIKSPSRDKIQDEYIFLFLYNDKLAKKLSDILNIEEYLMKSKEIKTN